MDHEPARLHVVSGEVGVGAGIILGDHLHRGVGGFGGEFGHMTPVPEGPACGCGSHGCVETYVGLEAILERMGFDATNHPRRRAQDREGPSQHDRRCCVGDTSS